MAVASFTSSASAQVLMDPTYGPQDGFKLEALASAQVRSGNAPLTLLQSGVLTQYQQDSHLARLHLAHGFGKGPNGDRFMNFVRTEARYRWSAVDFLQDLFGSSLGPEVMISYWRDEFMRREHLLDLGAGPFFRLLNLKKVTWTVTAAYTFEFEKFAFLTSPDNASEQVRDSTFELNSHRLWVQSELGGDFWTYFHLANLTVAQIPLDSCTCDTRILTSIYLRVTANDYIAMQLDASVLYDSRPAVDVNSFDQIVRSALVFML